MVRDDSLPPGLALAWGETTPNRRGPKPAFTVGEVVAASIALADADGVPALSLPRIADRLGLTTTALYRYIRNKDELVALMIDAAWGPPPDRIGRTRNWRTGATAWTEEMIARLAAHPCLLDLPVTGPPMTPNVLRWLEVFLGVMARSGLSTRQCVGCAGLLDGYARNAAGLRRNVGSTANAPARAEAITEFLTPRLRSGFPHLVEMLATAGFEDSDIHFGLTRILDGIEKLIADHTVSERGR